MKTKKYPLTERFINASYEAHGWIPQAFLSPKMYTFTGKIIVGLENSPTNF